MHSPETASIIMVVEDEPLLRANAVELLQDAGFETLEAPNADAALEIMQARWREVRVLFTDMHMPGEKTGIDLSEEVHRCWPHILLLVTSGGVTLRHDEIPDDGVFVPKPYGGSTLISQIQSLIVHGHSS